MRRTRQSFDQLFLFAALGLMLGCATSRDPSLLKTAQDQEAVSALSGIAESYTGKKLTDEQLNDLAHDLKNDEDAQSAVGAITGSLEGNNANIKYSPATGKRYSGDLDIDPETGVKLLLLEP